MKRIAVVFMVLAVLGLASTASALTFTDNFNDNTYAGVWSVDQDLAKHDGANWEGWQESGAMIKNAAYEYYKKRASVNGYTASTGNYSTKVMVEYNKSASEYGLIFGGDLISTMYTAGIAGELGTWNLMVQGWSSPNGGLNWLPTGPWNIASISAPSPFVWNTLNLEVTDSLATLTMGGDSVSMALSGAPGGKAGLYNSVGWTNFDDFSAEVTPIPEPASMLLLGSGLIGLFSVRKRMTK